MTDLLEVPDTEVVGALMQNVLDKILALFEYEDVSLPDRQYLAVGRTAHDCEQLTVSFQQMYLGPPGARADQPVRCHSPRSVVLTVQLVRCIVMPTGRSTTPNATATTDRTLSRMKDAWLLMDAVTQSLDDNLGIFGEVVVTDPQGEYQAIVLNVTVGVP